MPVLRTWRCLNDRCGSAFDSWEANPVCGACGCVRVSWVPAGGHVAGVSRNADADLRGLADNFGLTNMNSAQRDRGAKIVKAQPAAAPSNDAPITFAPGFSVPGSATGAAMCVPSSNPLTYKASLGVGQALSPNRAVPRISANTQVHASHKGGAA